MKKLFGIGNKTKPGGSDPARGSSGKNSELNSELVDQNILEINQKNKERGIKAKLLTKGNYLYIRGTFVDSDGIKKERKIPLRLTSEISNLVSAEARILQLNEYVSKNGFIPDQLLWDTPKVEVKGTTKGTTVNEAIKVFEIDYWKDKDRNKLPKQQTWKGILGHLNKLPQDSTLNMGVLIDEIKQSEPESDKRRKLCQYYKRFAQVNGLNNIELIDEFVGKYKAKQRQNIDPEKLIDLVDMVRDNEKWGWLTASLFVFGTRSGETFSLIPDLETGTATSVCIPKGKKSMYIKYPIALTKELAIKWELDNIQREYTFDLNSYDPTRTKYLGNQWLRYLKPRAKELGIGFLELTDIRHNWGIRSIHAGIDPRVASKSLGHSINTHYEVYNSTFEQIDSINASKKLNK